MLKKLSMLLRQYFHYWNSPFSPLSLSPPATFWYFTHNTHTHAHTHIDINVREKHWSAASRVHTDQGSNLPPRYVPWPGTEAATYWCVGWRSSQLSHPARAEVVTFSLSFSLTKKWRQRRLSLSAMDFLKKKERNTMWPLVDFQNCSSGHCFSVWVATPLGNEVNIVYPDLLLIIIIF